METKVASPFEVVYEGKSIDVRTDIATIPDTEWRIQDGSCHKGRVRDFTIIGTATEGASGSGREYRFKVAYDLLSGARVGQPKVEVYDYFDDLHKPDWNLLREFTGEEAAGLLELLKDVRLPESERPGTADPFEELTVP